MQAQAVQTPSEQARSGKAKKIRKWVIVLAIAAAAGGMFYAYYQRGGLDFDANATTGLMPGVDVEQRLREMQEQLDRSMIAFSINTSPVFANGAAEGEVMIENPEQNQKLIIAEMRLGNTDEILYTSGALRPGSYIEKIKLDRVLPKGVYDVTVYFKAYDLETQEFIGQAGAAIKLEVRA